MVAHEYEIWSHKLFQGQPHIMSQACLFRHRYLPWAIGFWSTQSEGKLNGEHVFQMYFMTLQITTAIHKHSWIGVIQHCFYKLISSVVDRSCGVGSLQIIRKVVRLAFNFALKVIINRIVSVVLSILILQEGYHVRTLIRWCHIFETTVP